MIDGEDHILVAHLNYFAILASSKEFVSGYRAQSPFGQLEVSQRITAYVACVWLPETQGAIGTSVRKRKTLAQAVHLLIKGEIFGTQIL